MPLIHSSSKEAVGENIKELQASGHPHDQSVAIALDVQRRAAGGKPKPEETSKSEEEDCQDGSAIAKAQRILNEITKAEVTHPHGYYRLVKGKVVYVRGYNKTVHGEHPQANLQQRTVRGFHPNQGHYLRSTDKEDRDEIVETAKRLGIKPKGIVSHEIDHHGNKGNYDHVHFDTEEQAQAVHAKLADHDKKPQSDGVQVHGNDAQSQFQRESEQQTRNVSREEEERKRVMANLQKHDTGHR